MVFIFFVFFFCVWGSLDARWWCGLKYPLGRHLEKLWVAIKNKLHVPGWQQVVVPPNCTGLSGGCRYSVEYCSAQLSKSGLITVNTPKGIVIEDLSSRRWPNTASRQSMKEQAWRSAFH